MTLEVAPVTLSSADRLVRIAEWAVARDTGVLATVGVGSCVGIVLYDATARVGALAHILLPSPDMARDRSNPARFAETAVPFLLDAMRDVGAAGPFVAKLVGGAHMFAGLLPASGEKLGDRNVEAARRALAAHGVEIVGEQTGGDFGRTAFLDVADGRVTVRSLLRGDVVI